jgi:glycosyltransferase involved in cell wall biosynthesis
VRVLHLGNLVNNGYLNAKFLRRDGIEADAFCDETHVISQPEWEEADVDTPDDHYAPLVAPGWQRPEWTVPIADPAARRRFRGEYWLRYRRLLVANAPTLRGIHARLRREYEPLREVLGAELSFADVLYGVRIAWFHRLLAGRPLRPFLQRYDVVQAYGTHGTSPLLVTPEVPLVAYEHGTLRDIPYQATPRARMMSLAYRLADRVVITNADVHASALRLGLENIVFIPHLIDERKYAPGASELGGRLRREGADFVVVSVTRHDWHEKGNDLMLHAFARLVADVPRAVLLLTEWGEDVARSKRLLADLGVASRVEWHPPLSKPRLIDTYRAADAVLDQFLIGTFGGITPEAMACARPVVMAFDADVHHWCFRELPPVLPARTAEEIHAHLARLAAQPEFRERVGADGREWVERNYSSGIVVERHRAIYEDVLHVPLRRTWRGLTF